MQGSAFKSRRLPRPAGTLLVLLLYFAGAGWAAPPELASRAADPWTPLGSPVRNSPSFFVDVDATRHALDPVLSFTRSRSFLGWVEFNSQGVPMIFSGFWTGSAWTREAVPHNRDTDHRAFHPAAASDGNLLFLAWTELDRRNIPQVYLNRFSDNQWSAVGESLNLNPDRAAAGPALAAENGIPYLAWSEMNSTRVYQIYLKQLTEIGWQQDLPSSLNRDPSRDVLEPSLVVRNGVLHLAWAEVNDQNIFQVRVKRRSKEGWEWLGESLNNNPGRQALGPALAIHRDTPYIAFTEADRDGIFRLYLKHWDGKQWAQDGGPVNGTGTAHAFNPSLVSTSAGVFLTWTEAGPQGRYRVRVNQWSGSEWREINPMSTDDTGRITAGSFIAAGDSDVYVGWKEKNPDGVFQIAVERTKIP